MRSTYLLIDGRTLYALNPPRKDSTWGNRYPVSLGDLTGPLPAGFRVTRANNGDTVRLWGVPYQVNRLPLPADADPDQIDLELVLLGDESEADCP